MKKLITLVLVLVLALCLSVPAMAFTGDTSEDVDHPYDLSIYLVEYEDNDLFGFATLPPSDRGYAKNEIVAAVAELAIPKDEDLLGDGYETLEITGDNVDFHVTDTPILNDAADTDGMDLASDGSDGWTLDLTDKAVTVHDDTTYKWLVFAKVTDDDACITVKLIDGLGVSDWTHVDADAQQGITEHDFLDVTLDGEDYMVNAIADSYIIWVRSGDYTNTLIKIDIDDENHETLGMSIDPNTATTLNGYIPLGVNPAGELGIVNGAVIDTDGDDFDAVMDIYEDIVVDAFGMDYFKIGNYVRDSFFEDLVSGDTIVATVDIVPFTAYVTVPDNIVVDPPKTGDAASMLGFMMVALAGSSAILIKKRG